MLDLRKLKVAAGGAMIAGIAMTFGGAANAGIADITSCVGSEAVSIEGVSYTTCATDPNSSPSSAAELDMVNAVFGGGFISVGKDEDTVGIDFVGGISGTFAIDTSLIPAGSDIALIFKTGQGQNDPDNAVFGLWSADALDANNIAPGSEYNGLYDLSAWGSNGLSHLSVFIRECTENCEPPCIPGEDPRCTPHEAPEPGPIGLLGLGIVGLYVARRKFAKN